MSNPLDTLRAIKEGVAKLKPHREWSDPTASVLAELSRRYDGYPIPLSAWDVVAALCIEHEADDDVPCHYTAAARAFCDLRDASLVQAVGQTDDGIPLWRLTPEALSHLREARR